MVAPDVGEKFEEFHASDVLAGNKPFEKIKRARAIEIFSTAINAVDNFNIPVIYGAVDLRKLYATDYATANPVDISFRICVKLIEDWFAEHDSSGLGLLICDNGDQKVKHAVRMPFICFAIEP